MSSSSSAAGVPAKVAEFGLNTSGTLTITPIPVSKSISVIIPKVYRKVIKLAALTIIQ